MENLNCQQFFNKLSGVSGRVTNALMVCEGMSVVGGSMSDRDIASLSSGVFNVLSFTLNAACDTLSAMESDFVKATGAKYPCSMTDEEQRDYRADNYYTVVPSTKKGRGSEW